jgi:hypothetical protein
LKLEICEGGGAGVDMILHYKFSTTIELQSCCGSISLFRMLFYIHRPFFPGIMLYIALSVLNPSLVRIIKTHKAVVTVSAVMLQALMKGRLSGWTSVWGTRL